MKKTFGIIAFLSIASLMAGCGDDDWGDSPLWVPTDVVATDIDGDGRTDVLTLAMLSTGWPHREGHLVVRRQTSPEVFAPPDTYVFGTYPWKLTVGDIDGDGLPDLVASDPDGHAVWLLLQNPNDKGKFLSPQQIASNVHAYEAAIADLNGDGAPDIAITDSINSSKRIVLLYQDPAHWGTFLPATDFTLPGTSSNVTVGDLNGDGRADLFTWIYLAPSGYTPNGELAINLQQANGMLGPVMTLAPQTGLNVHLVAIADYDGDGRNDLFAFFATVDIEHYTSKFTVLLQGAEVGTFSAPVDTSLAGIQGIDGATVADLNGDGRPDVAVVGLTDFHAFWGEDPEYKSQVHLFTHSDGGAFTLAAAYEIPLNVSRVAAGDIDGDGLNDLVLLGANNQCYVMIQSHTVPGTFNAPYQL